MVSNNSDTQLSRDQIHQRFSAIDKVLTQYQSIWRPEPFQHLSLEWTDQYPKFANALLHLGDAEFKTLQTEPESLLTFTEQALNLTGQLSELSALPSYQQPTPLTRNPHYNTGIPGRKLNQIEKFIQCLPRKAKYTDWCCGKGHLARLIYSNTARPVIGLEWDSSLCDTGNHVSEKLLAQVSILNHDVMTPIENPSIFDAHQVALHACGDLHQTVIRQSCLHGAPSLSISPCCYQKTAHREYELMSGLSSELKLSQKDLALAVQETVTAPGRDQISRHTLKLWRVAFDLIQRDHNEQNTYQPCPSTPASIIKLGFEALVQKFALHLQISLPKDLDYAAYLEKAVRRLAQIERLELARHSFRRLLELWLVYDRAMYLSEQGYNVQVGTFCDRKLTPRNILINAEFEVA